MLEYVWWWSNQRLQGELEHRTPTEIEIEIEIEIEQSFDAALESAQPAPAGQREQLKRDPGRIICSAR